MKRGLLITFCCFTHRENNSKGTGVRKYVHVFGSQIEMYIYVSFIYDPQVVPRADKMDIQMQEIVHSTESIS